MRVHSIHPAVAAAAVWLAVVAAARPGPALGQPARPAAAAAAGDAGLLTTAADVRDLPAEDAAHRRPARVRGIVTLIAPAPALMFVQDDTGGVLVTGRREIVDAKQVALKVGALVEVEGYTAAGRLVPALVGRAREPVRVTIIDDAPPAELQPAPLRVELPDMRERTDVHGDLVEVDGVVRAVRAESLGSASVDALVVTLAVGSSRVDLQACKLEYSIVSPK